MRGLPLIEPVAHRALWNFAGELAQQNKRIDQVKQALSKASATCAREDPFGPPGFRLSKQLQLAAENAGLQWAEDVPLDGSAFAATGEVAPLTIYSKTFQIDVKYAPRPWHVCARRRRSG